MPETEAIRLRKRASYIANHAPDMVAKLITMGKIAPTEAAAFATEALGAVFDKNYIEK